MKQLLTLFFAAALLCGSFTSCQKAFSEEDLEPPVSTNDSIYLDRIYDLYDIGAGMDTQGVSKFVYDSRKRVVSVIDSSFDPTIGGDTSLYFYNGTDTIPSRLSTRSLVDPSFGYSYSDAYFFYDAQNRKTQDSVIYTYVDPSGATWEQTRIFKYSYGAGLIYGQVWESDGINPALQWMYKDTATINANGDIASSKRYKLSGGNYMLNTNSSFTYDGHPSPFSKLTMFHAHRMMPNGETILGEYVGFQNIVSQQENTIDPSYSFSQNLIYEYRANGLPKKATNDIGTADEEILYFTYKNL